MPRFAFEKFKGAEAVLSRAMKSVGEVMAIGRNIHESLQKALRGLETGLSGFNFVDRLIGASHERLQSELARATPDRLIVAAKAIREAPELGEINRLSGYELGFLDRITEVDSGEEPGMGEGLPADGEGRGKHQAKER